MMAGAQGVNSRALRHLHGRGAGTDDHERRHETQARGVYDACIVKGKPARTNGRSGDVSSRALRRSHREGEVDVNK